MATAAQLALPRGIRVFTEKDREQPHACQWRVDGKRKTRFFATVELRDKFAVALRGDVKRDGAIALRLDPDEAREWRAFRADIGDATLKAVADCWRRHGVVAKPVPLADAIAAFLLAKEGEGVSQSHLVHFNPVFDRLRESLGNPAVGTITRAELAKHIDELDQSNASLRTNHKRIRTFFRWLKDTNQLAANPCDGWKAPKEVRGKIGILTVAEARTLFAKNKHQPREVLGRLALEAFCGMRHETASKIDASAFDFAAKVIAIPAAISKSRQEEFIEHAPDNLWTWLAWSKPKEWGMNHLTYRNAKGEAFVRADVPHPHNALRHSFASYHIAMNGDAGRTASILTHSNLRMLWKHYRGKGGGKAQGEAYFAIVP